MQERRMPKRGKKGRLTQTEARDAEGNGVDINAEKDDDDDRVKEMTTDAKLRPRRQKNEMEQRLMQK